jgi:Amt family ammonium transporter
MKLSQSIFRLMNIRFVIAVSFFLGMGLAQSATAQATESSMPIGFIVGNLWLLVATALVFIMHLGFATLEAGLTQQKNTVNILFKNVCIISIGILTYALVGFNLMYPGEEYAGGFFGFSGFWLSTDAAGITPEYNENYTYWTDFIFQAVFAATAVTIVSGAVAERIRVEVFLVFALIYVSLCYPIVGMWKWGGGFLDALETPFYDFAGSTIVHSVGGWAALVGSMMLGPRLGKYVGSYVHDIPPSNLPLATVGVFLLWFGWYGFNGGSVLSADPGGVSYVFVTTSIGAAAGILGAMVATVVFIKHLDLAMMLNGALAGLVGITAGADQLGTFDAAITGFIAGVLVVASVLFIDKKLKIDDPVGAISVHLVCGIWGTLAVGIFGNLASPAQFTSQVIGVVSVGAFCALFAFVVFSAIKLVSGLRVNPEAELEGLDHYEHGISGYRGFREEEQPLYEKLGEARVNAAVDVLYKKILADDMLKGYFEGIDIEQLIKHQKSFLAVAFGGGRLGTIGDALRKAHVGPVQQGISDAEFDRLANLLETTLAELKVSKDLIGEVLRTIDGLREHVLNR